MNAILLENELAAYGAFGSNIRRLDTSAAENIDYRDLVNGVGLDWERTVKVRLSAVVEFEQRPLLYVIRADAMTSGPKDHNVQLQALRSKLACRGDRAWLAVITPGQLTVYPVGFSKTLPTPVAVRSTDSNARLFFQDLVAGNREDLQRGVEQKSFHDLLFKLVTDANRSLLSLPTLKGKTEDVLSMVGRALFARFLIDRGLMNRKSFPNFSGEFEGCFSSPDKAAQTCQWQDSMFNGELLPLAGKTYRTFFRDLNTQNREAFGFLSDILHHAPDGQMVIKEAWGLVDFAHVPVGLLSEVYEQFAHEHGPVVDSQKAKTAMPGDAKKKKTMADAESIHYTPRAIASYMLDQAWPALKCEPNRAKVLDPAAGGGVFLGLAYRRLVAETWKAQKRAPTRKKLREILYSQIRGMDINESALRLAALSLYLTALELDPSPQDFTDMAFDPMIVKCGQLDNLGDGVLFHVRQQNEPHPNSNILGSLGGAVPAKFTNYFDLVVGNPPWTAWKGDEGRLLDAAVQEEIRVIAGKRAKLTQTPELLNKVAATYKNPYLVPDIAFVWKASEWAKQGEGIIALALHARLLFKRHGHGADARQALFNSVRVTGILNGTALRLAKVWPNVEAPWCLLFAVNQVPKPDNTFYFVSPMIEPSLNRHGMMRIDYDNASQVSLGALNEQPALLKTLFRGTAADADVLSAMSDRTVSLEQFWDSHNLNHGIGLQTTSHQEKSGHLKGKRYLSNTAQAALEIDVTTLPKFNLDFVHHARDPAIYKGPLVIIPQAIDVKKGRKSYLSFSECVFNRSFTGFSTAGFKVGGISAENDLARHLFLLTQSSLLVYYALMTSAQYGIERDTLLKEDIEMFPVAPFDISNETLTARMRSLCDRWVKGDASLGELDAWACKQYGLRQRHLQCIVDTLAVSSPQSTQAHQAPQQSVVDQFLDELQKFLQQYFDEPCRITASPNTPVNSSWRFLDVICGAGTPVPWMQEWVAALADQSGATRITLPLTQGHVGIAIVNEHRYWTKTRAYLTGLHILRTFSDSLGEVTG